MGGGGGVAGTGGAAGGAGRGPALGAVNQQQQLQQQQLLANSECTHPRHERQTTWKKRTTHTHTLKVCEFVCVCVFKGWQYLLMYAI